MINKKALFTSLSINKGIEEWEKGKLVVFLIPARTGTKRFHKLLELGAEFRFIKGRLKFGNQKNYAPFDSMVVVLKGAGDAK